MKALGIIVFVIAIAIGVYVTMQGSQSASYPNTDANEVNENIIDSAKEVVSQIEQNVPTKPTVEVYDGISTAKDTAGLDLSGRGLTGSLKAEINQLTDVKSIDLSNNKFTGVPAEIGQLTTLEVLDLSNNPITGLPHEIGNLTKLKFFNLKGTNYSKQDLDVIKQSLPETTQILVD